MSRLWITASGAWTESPLKYTIVGRAAATSEAADTHASTCFNC
ncbi:hypothetical protein OG783_33370 [Streptomyces jietaisiensis]